jgi:lipooligosaccharide transport system permease protein
VELGQGFTVLFRLIVIPVTLFSGTFFPVEQLPAVVRPLAWISPLWHGTELARAAALDRWALLPALGHPRLPGGAAGVRRGALGRLFTRRLAR